MQDLHLLQIRYAALLHDIGKFVQRASGMKEKHPRAGAECLKNNGFDIEFFKPVVTAVRYHHDSIPPDLEPLVREIVDIVKLADRWDAGQRETDEEKGKPLTTPLTTFFNENLNFPLSRFSDSYEKWKPSPRVSLPYHDTARGFDEMIRFISTIEKEPARFTALLTLLREYLTFVPSYTQTACKISLYDHSKAVAALASCIYFYKQQYRKLPSERDDAFLLLSGDFVGIQEFIYNIRRGAERGEAGKKFAKRLRGRSLIVQMLAHLAVNYLLEKLNLGPECVLFSSGGNFSILCPNTPNIREVVEECEHNLARFFREKMEPLGLVLATKEFAADKLKEIEPHDKEKETEFHKQVWKKLTEDLEKKKLQRDIGNLGNIFSTQHITKGQCRFCGSPTNKTEAGTEGETYFCCEICSSAEVLGDVYNSDLDLCVVFDHTIQEMGSAIVAPLLNCRVDVKEINQFAKQTVFDCPMVKALLNPSQKTDRNSLIKWMRIMPSKGISFFADYRPICSGKDLDELAKIDGRESTYLGYLMMDVDKLGEKFKQVRLLADLSAFSSQLDLFFSRALHAKVEGIENKSNPRGIYLVYSGGDDLFAVARWDDCAELASAVQKEFDYFYGAKLTISGGMALCRPRMPLYISQRFTKQQESKAKNYPPSAPKNKKEKNAFALFNMALSWKHYEDVYKLANELAQTSEKEISSSFLYNMLTLMQDESLQQRPSKRNYKIYYMVARHLSSGAQKTHKDKLLEKLKLQLCQSGSTTGSEEYCKSMLILSLTLLKRRVEREKQLQRGG